MEWLRALFTEHMGPYMPTNGVFAERSAAFMASLAIGAAFVFGWRMCDLGYRRDPRRFINFFWLLLMFVGIAGNRITVVLFYKGLTDFLSWLPLGFNVLWAFSTLMLARAFTIEYCGNKGWVSALVLSTVVMVLFG